MGSSKWFLFGMKRSLVLILAIGAVIFFSLGVGAAGPAEEETAEGTKLMRENFQKLVKRYEAEKELSPDKRMDTIEQFKIYPVPQCSKFLASILPNEQNATIIRSITISCAVVGRKDGVRAALTHGVPRLESLIELSETADAMIPPEWRYRTGKGWRQLPDFYFSEIAGSFAAIQREEGQACLVRYGLSGAIAKDPLLMKFMISIIGQVPHKDRAKTLASALSRTKDPQIIATVFDTARRARLKDSTLTTAAARYLKAKNRDIQVAAFMCLEQLYPARLKRELPKLVKSKLSEVRMLAASAILTCKADTKMLFALLDDEDWRVRVSVFRSVGRLESAAGVTALVERLKREIHPRAIDDLVDTLRRMTGVDVGRFPAGWAAWWGANKDTADLKWRDSGQLGEIKAQQAQSSRTASYYGLEVVSNFACFLMDSSKSMIEKYDVEVESSSSGEGRTIARKKNEKRKTVKKRKIDYARENLKRVLSKLPPRLQFNIITFNHDAKSWQDKLVKNTEGNRTGARAFLDELEPAGSTNIFDTLVVALSDEKVDTVYLLSDGAPTTGRITEPARIVEEIRRLNMFRKVKINTIGFHLKGPAEDLMRDLADDNFGAFVVK